MRTPHRTKAPVKYERQYTARSKHNECSKRDPYFAYAGKARLARHRYSYCDYPCGKQHMRHKEHIGKIHVKNKVYHILYYEIYLKQYHARKHRSVLIHILRVHDKAA